MKIKVSTTWRSVREGPRRLKCSLDIPLLVRNPLTQATVFVYSVEALTWPIVEVRSKISDARLIVRLTDDSLWLDTTFVIDETPLKGLYL